MSSDTIAVLDVGKTNKKVSLYNRELQVVAEERTTIQPHDFHGVEVEDTTALMQWFLQSLRGLAQDHPIRAIAVTTHGATFALLDDAGRLAHPVISYTCPRGAEVQDEFYEAFGSREELHRQTSTADVGFANMAKVLYFVKTRLPEAWARCRDGLFYGPYLGYELTGQMGLEPTFPGNHTYFWDFARQDWSETARRLNADALFGRQVLPPWSELGVVKPDLARDCGLPADCKVTLGIHDSNANFLPYLAKGYEDFLLNSTGTWCVLMRNSDTLLLGDDEIAAKVFFNQDALGRPVRTSLMTSGMDYDAFRAFTDARDEADLKAVRRVIAERKLFVIPGVLPEATAFPGSAPRVVHDLAVFTVDELRQGKARPMTALGQDYYAALNLGLAIATKRMLGHCGIGPRTTVFIEGGFAKNRVYCEALAALCPEQTFALTAAREGTAFGAALTGWMLADGETLQQIGQRFTVSTSPVPRPDWGHLAAYEAAFLRAV